MSTKPRAIHPIPILKNDFHSEWVDILEVLSTYVLRRSDIISPGRNKSPISAYLDGELYRRGWEERKFNVNIDVDNNSMNTPTHKIDCYKNRIGLEIEWNNKDPFYDRDLNNFRLLHQLNIISVGVIVTRASSLQAIFNQLGKGPSYGNSTTHMDKLIPRILGGGAGGCPVLAIGISDRMYNENS
ncbi:BglII/BstYI family type II restriction endonuclease [Halomonas sp. SIMBA_159]